MISFTIGAISVIKTDTIKELNDNVRADRRQFSDAPLKGRFWRSFKTLKFSVSSVVFVQTWKISLMH
jgi:hypothetical protein